MFQTITEKFDLFYMLIGKINSLGFFPTMFVFNKIAHLFTITISIFDLKFIDNLVWFNKTLAYDIPITSYYFINNKIGKLHIYINRKEIWH